MSNQLRRQNQMVGGVCGGLGAFFGISPLWFRLLFLILIPAAPPALLIYVIMWIVMPKRTYF